MATETAASSAQLKMNIGQIRPSWIIAELVGTMVLTLAALNAANNPVMIAFGVLILTLVLGKISGAHINPAITVSMWVTKKIPALKAIIYIVAQLLGAMLAVVVATKFLAKSSDPTFAAQVYTLFDAQHIPGAWRPIFGELAGAIFFGFGVASSVFGKKEGIDQAFTVAGALFVGIIIALSGSFGVLNPAIALGIGAYTPKDTHAVLWSQAAYGLAPIVGASLGALLFKYLKDDADKATT